MEFSYICISQVRDIERIDIYMYLYLCMINQRGIPTGGTFLMSVIIAI